MLHKRFFLAAGILYLSSFAVQVLAAPQPSDSPSKRSTGANSNILVIPRFGGQILGYAVDPGGTEGILSEAVALANGNVLAATETFDQSTGKILKVIAKTETQDDFATQGIFGSVGMVLYQHKGSNYFLTMNPFSGNKFNGAWKPPIKPQYQLWATSADDGSSDVAAYQSSYDTGLTYVFASNIAKNTFGPQISLQSIIDVDEFFHPLIALDRKTDEAVLADSQDCSEPDCVMSIALVNLSSGKITEFTDNLGVGTVNGLAVDSNTGIACTTTAIDQGAEFYNLAEETGFEVQIPNAGNGIQAGLDVEFDPIHKLFVITQYSSTGNPKDPEPRVYVYDEAGNVLETITGIQRIPVSPAPIALNPVTREGFIPVIVEPADEALELQSFSY
ncbi:MAG TPA: hypothetical protein VMB18_05105 [Terriglobales bacterium]|nr:hypothetical protein [Terriglobales bacterium]